MRALHDLILMGKVRYIGASGMYAWQFAFMNSVAEKHGWTEFVSMQPEYSLLYREEVCLIFCKVPLSIHPCINSPLCDPRRVCCVLVLNRE